MTGWTILWSPIVSNNDLHACHALHHRPERVEGRPRTHCRGSTGSPLGWRLSMGRHCTTRTSRAVLFPCHHDLRL